MPISIPSLRSLYITMYCNSKPIARGTGFVLSNKGNHYLITNRHNLTGRHQQTGEIMNEWLATPETIGILHHRTQKGHWHEKAQRLYDDEGNPLWIEHPIYGEKMDCVALRLTDLDDVELYSYDEDSPVPPFVLQPTDIVSVIGFPFGITGGGGFPIWATGFVASEPEVNQCNLPLIYIDCRGRPGQSGSPVIVYRLAGASVQLQNGIATFHENVCFLIGIYSGRINEQSDLGLVWKLQAIYELIGVPFRALPGTP